VKVSIAGTGYVGLVSGVCLAELGHEVVCVDIDKDKVEKINSAIPPIYEDGLEALLKKNTASGKLAAVTNLKNAVINSDITLIAVGTPFDGERIDLSYIKSVSEEIGKAIAEKPSYHVVVVKSTVVPGTTDDVVLPIIEKASGKKLGIDFSVGMNPEFLKEGEAIVDFMYPDRIVYGASDDKGLTSIRTLYDVFADTTKLETDNRTAEMIKYTANSLLATMISFSNEVANLCAIAGVDVTQVTKGVHLDKRLSPILEDGTRITPGFTTYIEAGCGFGGSCFPKDVKALVSYGEGLGSPMQLLRSVVELNATQPFKVIQLLEKHMPDYSGKTIAILGLSFKPGSDDMRESPAIPIINKLHEGGAIIKAYDPIAKDEAQKIFKNINIEYCENLSSTVKDVDVVILVTRWDEFSKLGILIPTTAEGPLIIDGRRMLDKKDFTNYTGIGL
jgi:UDPglucose 6-dehydrogenase/GDP-mannose 6-dehydrogenase